MVLTTEVAFPDDDNHVDVPVEEFALNLTFASIYFPSPANSR